jgi:predicted dehydrogenase
MNRREALKAGAAGAVGLAAPVLAGYHVAGNAVETKTHRVGLIGCGWYGKNDLFRLIQVAPVEVVALCDPDRHMLDGAAKMVARRQKSGKTPRAHTDYRDMLKQHGLDIVLIGTPDHWHALPTIAAVEAGADVYLQKPISVDVLEGEAMLAAARKHKRVVQVGLQRRSTAHLIDARKRIVEAGLLGKIGHVDVCCYYPMRVNGDPPRSPVPEWFDYEMWTGPAPLRPYDKLPHLRWWRTFMEYGNGIVGDMCVHMFDMVRWMLGLGWPRRVYSTGGILVQKGGKSNITDTQTATFEYDGLKVAWQHRTWGTAPDPAYPWAAFLYGDKGTLKASPASYDFIPVTAAEDDKNKGKSKGKAIHRDCVVERKEYPEDVTEPDIDLTGAPATRAHLKDFLAAVASRGKPAADIEQGHISTAACILANLSMRLGRPLTYDPARRQVAGDAEATRLLARPYRALWKHPASR